VGESCIKRKIIPDCGCKVVKDLLPNSVENRRQSRRVNPGDDAPTLLRNIRLDPQFVALPACDLHDTDVVR